MAMKKPVDERVRVFVASVLAERPENDDEHIDDIERDMEQLADAVADEVQAALLAAGTVCTARATALDPNLGLDATVLTVQWWG